LLLSVASVWETQIKFQLGKLKLTLLLSELIEHEQQTNHLDVLPILLPHVLVVQGLPAHHKDPFARLLIAQANVEDVMVVSNDPMFPRYTDKVLW
jgi:PIN domain nuclease of toxin-antitoxin system